MKYQLITKTWFDKINGNTYFASRLYNSKGELVTKVPFDYGYGSHHEYAAFKALKKAGKHKNTASHRDVFSTITKIEKCLKRDVKEWGETDKI